MNNLISWWLPIGLFTIAGLWTMRKIKRLILERDNLQLANDEARKTIDRLNTMIPREDGDGGPTPEMQQLSDSIAENDSIGALLSAPEGRRPK